jgi:16S rRNA G1207 methylase RsmC
MRRHGRPYDISYRGKAIRIFPGVFSPKNDWSAKFAVDCLPALAGKNFLEVGAGCGIVSGFYKAREPLLRAELQRAGLQVVAVREERRF